MYWKILFNRCQREACKISVTLWRWSLQWILPDQCPSCDQFRHGEALRLWHLWLSSHKKMWTASTCQLYSYRPFQCVFCPKNFQRRDLLRKHKRIHIDTWLYDCENCGKTEDYSGERPTFALLVAEGFVSRVI